MTRVRSARTCSHLRCCAAVGRLGRGRRGSRLAHVGQVLANLSAVFREEAGELALGDVPVMRLFGVLLSVRGRGGDGAGCHVVRGHEGEQADEARARWNFQV